MAPWEEQCPMFRDCGVDGELAIRTKKIQRGRRKAGSVWDQKANFL